MTCLYERELHRPAMFHQRGLFCLKWRVSYRMKVGMAVEAIES